MGSFGSLHGIKIHFREFLYGFMHKCNKLLARLWALPPACIPIKASGAFWVRAHAPAPLSSAIGNCVAVGFAVIVAFD
jgi:hypothetical protein